MNFKSETLLVDGLLIIYSPTAMLDSNIVVQR